MKASGVSKTIKKYYAMNKPLFIHGAVGIGKSEVMDQTVKELGISLIDIRLSQMDPVDLRGIPTVKDNKTVWNVPNFFPTSGEGIMFFDEANHAPPSMQAAMYQLVLDGRLGDYIKPKGWQIMLAGNRAIDRSIAHRMGDALKNRMGHIEFTLDLDDWVNIAIKRDFHTSIIAFNRFKPTALHYLSTLGHTDAQNAKQQAMSEQVALNTPRSWEMLHKFLMDDSIQLDAVEESEAINGIIGESTGAMYQGYLKVWRKLQTPEEIILNPMKALVDDDPGVLYATMTGLASRATEFNFDSVMKYLDRCPTDFQILCLRDCVARDRELLNTSVFNKWAATHTAVLF